MSFWDYISSGLRMFVFWKAIKTMERTYFPFCSPVKLIKITYAWMCITSDICEKLRKLANSIPSMKCPWYFFFQWFTTSLYFCVHCLKGRFRLLVSPLLINLIFHLWKRRNMTHVDLTSVSFPMHSIVVYQDFFVFFYFLNLII